MRGKALSDLENGNTERAFTSRRGGLFMWSGIDGRAFFEGKDKCFDLRGTIF